MGWIRCVDVVVDGFIVHISTYSYVKRFFVYLRHVAVFSSTSRFNP